MTVVLGCILVAAVMALRGHVITPTIVLCLAIIAATDPGACS